MKTQDEMLFQTNWEPEMSTTNEARSTDASTPGARLRWMHVGVALTLVAALAFMAGVTLGPTLNDGGVSATASWTVVPGGILVSAVPRTASSLVQQVTPVTTGVMYNDAWGAGLDKGYQKSTSGDQRPPTWTSCNACYDQGWAGGPGKGYHASTAGDARLPTWTACTTCYDQGWAGGPGKGYRPSTTP